MLKSADCKSALATANISTYPKEQGLPSFVQYSSRFHGLTQDTRDDGLAFGR